MSKLRAKEVFVIHHNGAPVSTQGYGKLKNAYIKKSHAKAMVTRILKWKSIDLEIVRYVPECSK